MFCKKCGKELHENDGFCGGCGAKAQPAVRQPIVQKQPTIQQPVVHEQQTSQIPKVSQPANSSTQPPHSVQSRLPTAQTSQTPQRTGYMRRDYEDERYVKKLRLYATLCVIATIVFAIMWLVGNSQYQEDLRYLRTFMNEFQLQTFRRQFYLYGERLRNFGGWLTVISAGVSGLLFYLSSRKR